MINTDDELSDDIILKKVVTLLTCVIKGRKKFYTQLFLDPALHVKMLLLCVGSMWFGCIETFMG